MRSTKLAFLAILLSIITTPAAEAESLYLGVYSPQTTQQLSQDITLAAGNSSHILAAADVQKWLSEKESLAFSPNYDSEAENTDFCGYTKSIPCELLFATKNEYHIQKNSAVFLDTSLIKQYLDDLARQTDRDPENAKLEVDEDGKVSLFSLGNTGLALDKDGSLKILISHFKNNGGAETLNLAYLETEPEVSADSINNLGITELIGEGRSNFAGSPKNRIFNIKVATNRFNGALIKPGAEFSFVELLGEVDGEHGYLPELVIKQNKTEPEFGGGICQVSTTAFRAAILSGLKITARKNHAYPVQYYNPQGFDSTVYIPRPDLRFINNTPSYILIQTKIAGTELIFQFYGADDGRRTEMIGPKILEKNPDGSMKTTFTQKVSDKDGNLFIDDVFNSAYDSPSKYPHPGDVLTQKPSGWSDNEWKKYKKEHNL